MPNNPESICEEAQRITLGDRRKQYNHPYENFKLTVDLLNAAGFSLNGQPLEPEDFATIMVQVKLARELFKPSRDNLVDIAGYMQCRNSVLERKAELAQQSVEQPKDEAVSPFTLGLDDPFAFGPSY